VKKNLTGRDDGSLGKEAGNRQGRDGLSGTGFADDPEYFSVPDVKRQAGQYGIFLSVSGLGKA
jgi:hypothetical protein